MLGTASSSSRVDLALCVAGQAGDGIVTTGRLLQRLLFFAGYHVSGSRTVPSRIRGGATALTVRVTDHPHTAPAEELDLLVAFEPEAVKLNGPRLKEGGLLLFDPGRGDLPEDLSRPETRVLELALRKQARELCGKSLYKAGGAVGAVASLLGIPMDRVVSEFGRTFAGAEDAIRANQRMAREGRDQLEEALRKAGMAAPPHWFLERLPGSKDRLLITGNQALALGALAAGCRFAAGYPITPATEILTTLIRHLPDLGGKAVQAEDELAAINMCTGAAWGGARAMTATSGPGLSLMAEGLGFAANAEVGFVVVDVQRPGPSTGMPTRTEQGDLHHAVHGGHGSFERIVLSPATAEEAFILTAEAFNLADEYQCPVILLTQQYLGQNSFTVDRFDLTQVGIRRGQLLPLDPIEAAEEPIRQTAASPSEDAGVNATPPGWYPRFALTDSGLSPRVMPGTPGGLHLLNANEHDESGHIDYSPGGRRTMVDKRAAKLAPLRNAPLRQVARVEGDPAAPLWLVGWGATYGGLAEARRILERAGRRLAHLHLRQLWPLPETALAKTLGAARSVVVVENNQEGQLAGLLRANVKLHGELISLVSYDGAIFTGPGLARRIAEVLA